MADIVGPESLSEVMMLGSDPCISKAYDTGDSKQACCQPQGEQIPALESTSHCDF